MENQINIDIELVKSALFEKDIIIQQQARIIQQLNAQIKDLQSKLSSTTKENAK